MPALGVCIAGRDQTGLQEREVSELKIKCFHCNLYVPLESPVNELTYGRPNWFDRVGEEHTSCRERVALFDLSAFAKLEVEVHTYTSTLMDQGQYNNEAHVHYSLLSAGLGGRGSYAAAVW